MGNPLKDGLSLLAQHDDPKYWIEQALLNMGPAELTQAIETKQNIIINFFDSKSLNFPGFRKRARALLDKNWDQIEHFLLDPKNTLEMLEQVEGNIEIIGTDEGIDYVNQMCVGAYYWIREFVYQERQHLMEALQEEPDLPLLTFREVSKLYNIEEDMFAYLLNKFEQEGVISIYIRLNKKYRKEA